MRTVAKPDLQSLSYLVFDRKKLVAAFAMHDDAEHWIEEFGNREMKLLDNSSPRPSSPQKRRRADNGGGKTRGVAARKR